MDHLAHGLVLASGNTPTRRTVFPVLSTRPSALHVDGGVSAAALAAIDAVQPYQRRDADRHPLHVLHQLSNIDKHRSLHVTVAQVTGTQIFLDTPDGSALFGGQFRTDPLGHDDIIGAFELADGAEAADLLVEASGSTWRSATRAVAD